MSDWSSIAERARPDFALIDRRDFEFHRDIFAGGRKANEARQQRVGMTHGSDAARACAILRGVKAAQDRGQFLEIIL